MIPFNFTLKPQVARKLKKKDYKEATSWLRLVRRKTYEHLLLKELQNDK